LLQLKMVITQSRSTGRGVLARPPLSALCGSVVTQIALCRARRSTGLWRQLPPVRYHSERVLGTATGRAGRRRHPRRAARPDLGGCAASAVDLLVPGPGTSRAELVLVADLLRRLRHPRTHSANRPTYLRGPPQHQCRAQPLEGRVSGALDCQPPICSFAQRNPMWEANF
jgi:hypothetical protein